jgi:hypothetical protein
MKTYTTVLASALASTLCLAGTTYGQFGTDECIDATEANLNTSNQFQSSGSTESAEACGDCSGSAPEYYTCNGGDVWFKITLASAGSLTVDTCAPNSFDTDLTLYQGECAFMAAVGCSGDGTGLEGCQNFYSAISYEVPSAGVYHVRVGGYNGATGLGQLNVGWTGADDCDGDGTPDDQEADCDSDGTPDDCETDCDDNGTPDDCETDADCNSNGILDACDADCDDNGTPDDCETGSVDCNANGIPDACDIADETSGDFNNNDIPDECEAQTITVDIDLTTSVGGTCFSELVPMSGVVLQAQVDVEFGFTGTADQTWAGDVLICMQNPDSTGCVQLGGFDLACDPSCGNVYSFPGEWGTPTPGTYSVTVPLNQFGFQGDGDYSFQICHGWSNASEEAFWVGTVTFSYLPGAFVDCNDNSIPDDEEVGDGTAEDCNTNGIPDECEGLEDCNTDGIADTCQLASDDGTLDCDGDGVIDACEPASPDRDNNGVIDYCEAVAGPTCDTSGSVAPDSVTLINNLGNPCTNEGQSITECEGDTTFSGAQGDTWVSITVDGPGVLALTMCDNDGDDTDLVIWDGCSNGIVDANVLACSGDEEATAECQLFYSAASVTFTEAGTVQVQMSGFNCTLINTYLTSTWTPDTTSCEGDFDGNNSRDGGDLGLILGGWGAVSEAAGNAAFDLDGDLTVGGGDIGLFLGLFGPCP